MAEKEVKMETILITANARKLIVGAHENIITIADDIKREIETKDGISTPKIVITNGVDYSKESALKMINDKSIATKWVNTIDENNEALVIVLERGE